MEHRNPDLLPFFVLKSYWSIDIFPSCFLRSSIFLVLIDIYEYSDIEMQNAWKQAANLVSANMQASSAHISHTAIFRIM